MKSYKLILLSIILVIGVAYIFYDKGFKVSGSSAKTIQPGTENPLGIEPDRVFFLSFKNKGGSFATERAEHMRGEQTTPVRLAPPLREKLNSFVTTSCSGLFRRTCTDRVPQFLTTGIFNTIRPKWVLLDPEGAIVNQNLISGLIDNLTNLRIRGIIPKPEQDSDPATYGLVNPQLSVAISDTTERVLEFGELNFISGRRYLRIKGDDNIYLVDSSVFNDLDLLVGQVREATPYKIDIGSITEVSATPFSKASLRLVKEANGDWYVDAGGNKFIADKEIVEQTLNSALNFTVEMFLDQVPSSRELQFLGLSPADLTLEIVVSVGEGKQVIVKLPKILFGQAVIAQYGDEIELLDPDFGKNEKDLKKAYFSKLEVLPFVYKLPSMVYRAFAGDAQSFRDRKPFRRIDKETVTSVQILLHSPAGDRGRSPLQCTYSRDEPGRTDPRIIDDLLDLVSDFQVITYMDDSAEVKGGEVEIVLSGNDKTKIAVLAIKGSVLQNNDNIAGKAAGGNATDAPRYAHIQVGEDVKPLHAIVSAPVAKEITDFAQHCL